MAPHLKPLAKPCSNIVVIFYLDLAGIWHTHISKPHGKETRKSHLKPYFDNFNGYLSFLDYQAQINDRKWHVVKQTSLFFTGVFTGVYRRVNLTYGQ